MRLLQRACTASCTGARRSCEAAQQRSAGASAGAWRAYTSARCAALAVSRSAPQNGGVQRKASPRAV